MGFAGEQLVWLNQCRLYLRVLWLSELCTADGTKIELRAMNKPFTVFGKPLYRYPNQGNPSSIAWSMWASALKRLCRSGNTLTTPVGPWTQRVGILWWYDEKTSRLYQNLDSKIVELQRSSRSNTRAATAKFRTIGCVSSVPAEAVPASAFINQQEVVLTGIGKLVTLHAETKEPDLQWIWNNLQLPSNIKKELTNDIDIMAVSDGSFKEEHGTAAWIVVVSDKCCIEGKVITPGLPSVQSAYRSELAGIFGILATITLLKKRFHVRANITIGCDGLSAIHQASYLHDCVDPNALHYDLIMAC
jgi:hypothetical protein